jgi:Holliday junction resolvase RusA-like endonuclease
MPAANIVEPGNANLIAVVVPLPPQGINHGYRATAVNGRAQIYKCAELKGWEQEIALTLPRWEPPNKQPLWMSIELYVPRRLFRRVDIDGMVKWLVDAVIGTRADQYVDELRVTKQPVITRDGYAVVSVGPLGNRPTVAEME